MAKDFFDEEYEKQEQKDKANERNEFVNEWYSHPAPESTKRSGKPLYIVLICVALVMCIGFGWLLCWIVQSVDSNNVSDSADDVLGAVVDYMKKYYYKDIDDDAWIDAIEMSGTALMQTAGDQYSRLLSPQSHYDLDFPVTSDAANGKVFGVSFLVEEGIGLYVSSVSADSAAFGKLFDGDIVLKLSNMLSDDGTAPVVGGTEFSEIDLGKWSSDSVTMVLAATDSATFHVLREDSSADSGYVTLAIPLQRAVIPVMDSTYDFQFVEFYFDKDLTNVSTSTNKPFGAATSTEEQRHLDELPADTGYVRIKEFMYYTVDDQVVSCADEFTQVMELFRQSGLKHLVLDLKGNPGGRVDYAVDILAKLVTPAKLSDEQKSVVVRGDDVLLTYLDIPKPSSQRQYHYRSSEYAYYFGDAPSERCDIAVWTDGNSASASELVTGCLRDYRTAVQMGVKTYGKGIAQSMIDLPFDGEVTTNSGSKMKYSWSFYYTCANYYSPLGVNIHGVGYTPDAEYNGLETYDALVAAVNDYWGQ